MPVPRAGASHRRSGAGLFDASRSCDVGFRPPVPQRHICAGHSKINDTVLVSFRLRRPPLSALAAASLTYPDVGATSGPLPTGYRHVTRVADLGRGREVFDLCSSLVLSWEMHRRAGLTVQPSDPVAREGSVVALVFGASKFGVVCPCRVVYVVEEPGRRGFAYGTLPGHPEEGEESFMVTHEPDGSVVLRITAFSRPANALSRLGGPLTQRVQDWITDRYVAALQPKNTAR
jgi:uncharacterized protein (UPF0548 family)